MSDDLAGGVAAPVDAPAAVVTPNSEAPPAALGSQVPTNDETVKPEADKPSQNAGEAIRKAAAEAKAKAAVEPAKDAKSALGKDGQPVKAETEAAKAERLRTEQGKFAKADAPAATTQTPALTPEQQRAAAESPNREPPARFSPDAKAAWEAAPEPIRAEVHRAIRELEQGHQKYKADAEAHAELREFDEMAKRGGTTLRNALTAYTGIEGVLRRDPIAGLEQVVQNLGLKTPEGRPVNLRDIAEHILSQSPEEMANRQTSTKLESEVIDLRRQLAGITEHVQKQAVQSTHQQIDAFATQHPRFDELAQDIEFFIRSGRTSDLSEAYQMAERLNPASSQASQQQPVIPATASVRPPLNPAGSKSIAGAPSPGSDPAAGPPSKSVRAALERAMAKV